MASTSDGVPPDSRSGKSRLPTPGKAFDIGINDRVRVTSAVSLGFQNILGLAGLLLFPGLIGKSFHLAPRETAYLYGITFMTSGLVVVLQSVKLLRLPIVQGPFAGVFAALIAVGHRGGGLGTAFGSLLLAAVIWCVLAVPVPRYSPIAYLAKHVEQPLVTGVILLLISSQLATVALTGWIGEPHAPGFPWVNLGCAALTAVAVLACTGSRRKTLHRGAIFWGVVAGALVYSFLAPTTWDNVLRARLFNAPRLFPFGFGISALDTVIFFIALFPAITETMATYRMVADWANEPLPPGRVAQGIFGEVLGSAIGALFGGMSTLAYPDNVGLLRVTRVASRWVTLTTGIILLALGGFGYFDAALVAIPNAVLSGATAVLFGILFAGGLQVMARVTWSQGALAAAGVSFVLPIGGLFISGAALHALPVPVQLILQQPLITGTILALAGTAMLRVPRRLPGGAPDMPAAGSGPAVTAVEGAAQE